MDSTEANAIEINNLCLKYWSENSMYEALRNINLTVRKGEFICIIGSSGCGKSTLLSVLSGLNKPSSGSVRVNGNEIHGAGEERAVVFQSYSLFPWMSAKQNIAFAVYETAKKRAKLGKGARLSKKESQKIAMDFLAKVDLKYFEDKLPGELSGGMQQRVAIARAMATNPEILLMDEPFGALDPKIRQNLQSLLLKLWGEDSNKKTVVFVTHDMDEAILLADRIVFMLPQRIHSVIDVDFPRPRQKKDILAQPASRAVYERINALFDEQVDFVSESDKGAL
ncbi:MAG: ABC transporter ATP-binding protein [Treponema sp.]|nr:ABC transporter ATP-binding protein [Treponema sp.]